MLNFSPGRLIERAADQLGFDLRAKWRMQNLPLTQRIQALFEHFEINAVIDVGGNKGEFRDQLRYEAGFTGHIYSFEPDPTMVATLQRRAATDPAWTIFPVALGAEAGTLPLNIMRYPGYNSFNTPVTSGHQNGNTVVQTVEVEVRTLDSMAASFPDLAHTYLKIDTQGFDLEVIKGGRNVVNCVPALQTEVSLRPLYVNSPSMDTSLSTMRDLGFVVADMFLVSADGDHRAIEFDCLMVRKERAADVGRPVAAATLA